VSARVLVVDDEEIVLRSCLRALGESGYRTEAAAGGAEALAKIADGHYDVLILDIMMPKMDGIEVLRRVKETNPDIEVVMITGLSQIETAVRAMKLGAFDYLSKPFDPEELRLAVGRALERRRLLQENLTLKNEVSSRYRLENIIGASPRMQGVYRLIAKCAPTNSTVLLTGENGTGKELVARAIHYNSLRKDGPFVPVDCNALSENLLESELFGHVKGSFTGAVTSKRGLFEAARGGTLFLDEIGNISLPTQAKLLRVIQEREFRAVGDTRSQEADVRIVAATNKDLVAMVRAETFREDLYYRVNIFPIQVPPLRERRDDIPALAHHFLGVFSRELGRQTAGFSEDAMAALVSHAWPGNVRELENAVQRGLILAGDGVIRRAHVAGLAAAPAQPGPQVPRTGAELKQAKKAARERSVEGIEKEFVLEALRRNAWNVTRSAEAAGMLRANFQALMKKHGIQLRDAERSQDPSGGSSTSS